MELAGVTVPVTDMQKAIAFYRQLLGRSPAVEDPTYSLFEWSGRQLGLLAVTGPISTPGPQPLFRTGELDREQTRLAAFATEVGEIQEQQGYRLLLFTDPDGNVLEIYES